jgi:hypothetical protein
MVKNVARGATITGSARPVAQSLRRTGWEVCRRHQHGVAPARGAGEHSEDFAPSARGGHIGWLACPQITHGPTVFRRNGTAGVGELYGVLVKIALRRSGLPQT